jgi:dynein heavy chain
LTPPARLFPSHPQVRKWLKSFIEIGQLVKRLDIGEGNYMKELEEDYDVYDSINQVSL